MSSIVTLDEAVEELRMSRPVVRRLFSDHGGPLYRIPGTGRSVRTTRASLDRYLTDPEHPDTKPRRDVAVTVTAGPSFS